MIPALRVALPCLMLLLPLVAGAQAPSDATPAPGATGTGSAPGAPPPAGSGEGQAAPMVVPRDAPPPTTADRDMVVTPPAAPTPSGTPLVTPPNLDDPNRPQSR